MNKYYAIGSQLPYTGSMGTTDRLRDASLLIVFLYEPMGLGHIRVTKALYEGLPEGVSHYLLGADDAIGNVFHRVTSSYPLAKTIMERMQYGFGEHLITYVYRYMMKFAAHKFYSHLTLLLKEQMGVPKTVLVVADHPGPAYKFASIKKKFAKEQHVRTFLVVQVTDDSPQHPWDIPEADIIFTPSEETTRVLARYHRHEHSPATHFVTSAYPISPLFAQPLTNDQKLVRRHQLDPKKNNRIHVSVPISGAAVGLEFSKRYMHTLSSLSDRFFFHIIAKQTSFAEPFLESVKRHANTDVQVSSHDREVVTLYEQLYLNTVIALDVTKPSEQAFKALADPQKVGGAILLFTDPVGRQEYDNLNFLEQRGLIPSEKQMMDICSGTPSEETIRAASSWRGIVLPQDPEEAAHCTFFCLTREILKQMAFYQPPGENSRFYSEVNPYGVAAFWKTVSYLLN